MHEHEYVSRGDYEYKRRGRHTHSPTHPSVHSVTLLLSFHRDTIAQSTALTLHSFTFPYSFTHSGGNTCSPTHSLICTKWWKTSGLSHSHSHNMRHITTEGMALSIFHTEWYAHSLTYSLYTCTEYATSDFQLHSFTHLHRVEGTLTSSHTFLTFGAKLHFQHSVRGWSTEWTRVFVYKSL